MMKKLFDYVVKDTTRGGIIVFEDIDVMTNIVHKRDVNVDDNITNISQGNDSLTFSYFLNLLDGTICSDNTIFALTTNHKENLDPALYRTGRIDVDIEFQKTDHYQIKNIFRRIIDRDLNDKILNKIPENIYTPADIIFHILPSVYTNNASDEEIMKKFMEN